MNTIGIADWPNILEHVTAIMNEHRDGLCLMDANMGDGDLGLTMKKSYDALPTLYRDIDEPDMGKRLSKAGLKLASVAPSTMGTLMASGWMEGGKRLVGVTDVDGKAFSSFLEGFSEGVAKRGKCKEGERTLLDAVGPAARSAIERANAGGTLKDVVFAALEGAQSGVEATKNMLPKYGKAAVFAAKAIGVADQGATAGMLMIQGVYNGITSNE